jgi:hypothetical protein
MPVASTTDRYMRHVTGKGQARLELLFETDKGICSIQMSLTFQTRQHVERRGSFASDEWNRPDLVTWVVLLTKFEITFFYFSEDRAYSTVRITIRITTVLPCWGCTLMRVITRLALGRLTVPIGGSDSFSMGNLLLRRHLLT